MEVYTVGSSAGICSTTSFRKFYNRSFDSFITYWNITAYTVIHLGYFNKKKTWDILKVTEHTNITCNMLKHWLQQITGKVKELGDEQKPFVSIVTATSYLHIQLICCLS